MRAGHADIAGAVGLHGDRHLGIAVVDGHLGRARGHQAQRGRGPRRVGVQLQPTGIAGRWPPRGGVLVVNGGGERTRRVRPTEGGGIRGRGRCGDAAIVLHYLGQRASGGIIAQSVAHGGGVIRGQWRGDRAGERAVVAVAQRRRIGDDVRVGGDQLMRAGKECERFPTARYARRIRRRQVHGEVGVENHDVDFPEGVDLARNVSRRTRNQVMAHRDGPDTEALQNHGCRGRVARNLRHCTVHATDGLGRDERDGVADGPGDVEKRLRRLIARPAPVLPRKGGRRVDEHARIQAVHEGGGLVPIVGHLLVRALRQQPARPGGGGRTGNHQAHQKARCFTTPQGQRPRQPHPGGNRGHAEPQRDAHQRVEFMHVAQRGQRAVERVEVPGGMRAEHGHPHQQHDGPLARQPGQAHKTQGGHGHGDKHEDRLGGQLVAGDALGIHKGRPAGGAAQNFRQVEPARGHASRLDEFCKGRGIAAQDEQRGNPPRGYRSAPGQPHQAGLARAPPQQNHTRRQASSECGRGVDRAHAGHRHHRGRGVPPAQPARPQEGQQHPGREHDRPGF